MRKQFTAIAGIAIALSCASSALLAQGLSTGPNLLRPGGVLYKQLNAGDPLFNPYVVEKAFSMDYIDNNNATNEQAVNFEMPTREQLVDLRVDVKADGSVDNIRILGGMYDQEFLADAMHAMEESIFKPASSGETAIDFPDLDMRVLLRGPFLPGIAPELQEEYIAAVELVEDEFYAEGEARLKELLTNNALRLFEYALIEDQLATVFMTTQRMHEGLLAARNATAKSKAVTPIVRANTRIGRPSSDYPDAFLPQDLYVPAMRRRFLLAASLNQTGEALEVYEELSALDAKGVEGALTDITGIQQQLVAALAAEAPIGSVVKLVNGVWTYEVSSRHIFGVTGLQGKVDYIDISCIGNDKRRMAFTNDSEFALPASWQNCTLEFRGEDGSQLTLYEYLN